MKSFGPLADSELIRGISALHFLPDTALPYPHRCPAYDPKTNFVFLPGMSISNHDNLQTLPPEQDARDELAFTPAPAVQVGEVCIMAIESGSFSFRYKTTFSGYEGGDLGARL